MKSILFGVIFWAVLLVMIWLIRPKSKLLGITMERWSMAHRLVTILVLAALIGIHANKISIGGILISVAGACLVIWAVRKLKK